VIRKWRRPTRGGPKEATASPDVRYASNRVPNFRGAVKRCAGVSAGNGSGPFGTSRGNAALNSALARRGGRVVGTDRRSLSFVHQVPSNGEEYEKDSDDDPNFDAGHNEVTPRCKRNSPIGPRILLEKSVLIGTGRGSIALPARSNVEVEKKPRPAGGRGLD